MEHLAPPLAHDFNDERRGSWTGDFDPSRRTSFSNSFLETPPALERKFPRFPSGSMQRIPLDEENDLMGTPPISPVPTRNGRPSSSYFDTPTRATPRRSAEESKEHEGNLFSTMLNKAFETVSKSGEAMDVHGRDVVDLSKERRAAKGKAKALSYEEADDDVAQISGESLRPTSMESTSGAAARKIAPAATARTTADDDRDFYATHPFEAGLVDVLEATEKKVSQWWAWLSDEKPTDKTKT